MRIEVDRLTEQGEAFAHTYRPEEIALGEEDARLTAETSIAGRASRKGDEVRLAGTLKGGVEAHCDRCLRPVHVAVEAEFDERLIPATIDAAPTTDELTGLQPEDLGFSTYEGEAVDVDEFVREQILLALPMRLLCREDCRGLCPTCGADLNTAPCACEQKTTDPRWSALADLKKEVNGQS